VAGVARRGRLAARIGEARAAGRRSKAGCRRCWRVQARGAGG